MIARLSSTGVAAGGPNTWKQLRIAIPSAARPMKKMYGNMMRFKYAACSSSGWLEPKRLKIRITWVENTIPRMLMAASPAARVQKRRLAKSQTSSSG